MAPAPMVNADLDAVAACYAAWAAPLVDGSSVLEAALAASAGAGEGAADAASGLQDAAARDPVLVVARRGAAHAA